MIARSICGEQVDQENTLSVDGKRTCRGCLERERRDLAFLEEMKSAGLAAGIEYGTRTVPNFNAAEFGWRTEAFRHMVAAMIVAARRKDGGK